MEGKAKTPAGKAEQMRTRIKRKRRGGSALARGKRSLARKSTVVSQAVQII
ncbi:hypothetical protein [Priestia megaterium]|uniref:hypothetical protein n=1 Tax=Priestia megaterium TaxID=1404 RepID=UPI000405AAF9|nr:hypothetical protein [Bacillus sp. S35]